ncbi:MAG TPA: glycosyltransferase family 4 protein [Candidatus Acidoferrum sp.]|nr:glycosyltransferase family 4 protein [Candidatus Acidoferrum sp.]
MKQRVIVLSILDGLSCGGDENRVLQLAQAIDRERFDFRVATIRPPDPALDRQFGSLRDRFVDAGIPLIDLSVPRVTRGLGANDVRRHVLRVTMLRATVQRIVEYVRHERVDLIDGHHGAGYLCGTIAGMVAGVPTLMTTYNVREAWSPQAVWNSVHGLTLASVGAVVTDSYAVADQVRSRMPRTHHSRVRVIPNGPSRPQAERSDAQVRAFFGLPPRGRTRVIAQIAALLPGKGQHLLIAAAPAVLARHPDVTFLLVGYEREQQGYGARLRATAEALGVGDNVVIGPYPGPIGDVWQTVDIHAHPTMLDSLPNAILEGMSLGKPVVASAIAGIPTLVAHERTGMVVPPDDVPALADALIRLLDQPEMARAFGEAARRRFDERYTQELLARRMEALFSELAAAR